MSLLIKRHSKLLIECLVLSLFFDSEKIFRERKKFGNLKKILNLTVVTKKKMIVEFKVFIKRKKVTQSFLNKTWEFDFDQKILWSFLKKDQDDKTVFHIITSEYWEACFSLRYADFLAFSWKCLILRILD